MISPIQRMTSAFSSAGDRSSRFPGGDMPLQNLKSLYAESPDLPIFTRAVSPCPPTAAASKTSAARTFAPITVLSCKSFYLLHSTTGFWLPDFLAETPTLADKYGEIAGDVGNPAPVIAGFWANPLRPRS